MFVFCFVYDFILKKNLCAKQDRQVFFGFGLGLFSWAYLPSKKCSFLPIKRSSRNQTLTPWKINMEPANNPFRKENDLPNLQEYVPC